MKILALGDSFTYGEELENRAAEGWVFLVAKELNAELRNAARPGCSNDYIIKRLIREIVRYKTDPDLIIIGWSSCSRIEEGDDMGVFDHWPARTLVGSNANSFREERVKYRTLHNNENWEYKRWIRQVILVQDFCRARGLDFRFINCFHNHRLIDQYREPWLTDEIDVNRFYGWEDRTGMVNWAWNSETKQTIDRMPKGHPGPLSNRIIADKFLEYHRSFRSDI